MKFKEILEMSLADIGKGSAEQDTSAEVEKAAIRCMNIIMFENASLSLGFTAIESTSDDLTTPNWSWAWMQAALSLKMSIQYGDMDSYMVLKNQESDALSRVQSHTSVIPMPGMSSNVPVGSGNGHGYYEELDYAVLSEQGQAIVTEGQ